MITNPVYNREMKVSARSIRFPLILACFNIILAAFALTSMTSGLSLATRDMKIMVTITTTTLFLTKPFVRPVGLFQT